MFYKERCGAPEGRPIYIKCFTLFIWNVECQKHVYSCRRWRTCPVWWRGTCLICRDKHSTTFPFHLLPPSTILHILFKTTFLPISKILLSPRSQPTGMKKKENVCYTTWSKLCKVQSCTSVAGDAAIHEK